MNFKLLLFVVSSLEGERQRQLLTKVIIRGQPAAGPIRHGLTDDTVFCKS